MVEGDEETPGMMVPSVVTAEVMVLGLIMLAVGS